MLSLTAMIHWIILGPMNSEIFSWKLKRFLFLMTRAYKPMVRTWRFVNLHPVVKEDGIRPPSSIFVGFLADKHLPTVEVSFPVFKFFLKLTFMLSKHFWIMSDDVYSLPIYLMVGERNFLKCKLVHLGFSTSKNITYLRLERRQISVG